MAKISVLVDTDTFIDYFNLGRFSNLFNPTRIIVYYSIVTKKELLSKPGFPETEGEAILEELSGCPLVKLTEAITKRFAELIKQDPGLEKADALITAGALVKRLPFVTRNKKHFKFVSNLTIFGP